MVAANTAPELVVECVRRPDGHAMVVVCPEPGCGEALMVTWRGSSDDWERVAERQFERHAAGRHPGLDLDLLEYVTRPPRGGQAVLGKHEVPTNRAQRRTAKRKGRR